MPLPGVDALAAYRRQQNMPVAGSPADDGTAARLDVAGRTFYGRNGEKAAVTLAPLNPISRTHAEAHAFQKARDAGVQAKTGVLYVDRGFCPSCGKSGGLGSMLRSVGLEKVLAITPEGSFRVTADRPSSPQPLPLQSAEAQEMLRASTAPGAQPGARTSAAARAAVGSGPSWSTRARQVAKGVVNKFQAQSPPPAPKPAPKPAPPAPAAPPAKPVPKPAAPVPPEKSEAALAAEAAHRIQPRAYESMGRPGVPGFKGADPARVQAEAKQKNKGRAPRPGGR